MKIRSEWITVLTLSSLAVYMMTMSKPSPSGGGHRDTIASSIVDRTPVGSVRTTEKRKLGLKP